MVVANSIHPGLYSDTFQGAPILLPQPDLSSGMPPLPSVPTTLIFSTGEMEAESVQFVVEQSLTGQTWTPVMPNVLIDEVEHAEQRAAVLSLPYIRIRAVFSGTDPAGFIAATILTPGGVMT